MITLIYKFASGVFQDEVSHNGNVRIIVLFPDSIELDHLHHRFLPD